MFIFIYLLLLLFVLSFPSPPALFVLFLDTRKKRGGEGGEVKEGNRIRKRRATKRTEKRQSFFALFFSFFVFFFFITFLFLTPSTPAHDILAKLCFANLNREYIFSGQVDEGKRQYLFYTSFPLRSLWAEKQLVGNKSLTFSSRSTFIIVPVLREMVQGNIFLFFLILSLL